MTKVSDSWYKTLMNMFGLLTLMMPCWEFWMLF